MQRLESTPEPVMINGRQQVPMLNQTRSNNDMTNQDQDVDESEETEDNSNSDSGLDKEELERIEDQAAVLEGTNKDQSFLEHLRIVFNNIKKLDKSRSSTDNSNQKND